ncbi:MAG: hypothetical protein LQ349_007029 [Xanthoria aureola]|nr:MAG: hypothetical protein LQ349_007029 [Xanthoria aureola]
MENIVISKPEDIVHTFKQSAILTNKPYRKFISNTFGVPEESKILFSADVTGLRHKPQADSGLKQDLGPLADRFTSNLIDRLEGEAISSEWKEYPDLYTSVRDHMFHASVFAMFGEHLFKMSENFCAEFWEFGESILRHGDVPPRLRVVTEQAEKGRPVGSSLMRYDLAKFCRSPLLRSLYAETLRLHASNKILRSPLENFDIRNWRISPGKTIAMMSYPLHHDSKVYNTATSDDPRPLDDFWADRFLVPRVATDHTGASAKSWPATPASCTESSHEFSLKGLEGRQFAKQEVLLNAALLLGNYDELTGSPVGMDWRFFGTGSMGVKEITSGLSLRNLRVFGRVAPTDYQKTVGNFPQVLLQSLFGFLGILEDTKVEILRGCDGLIQRGEMLLVLGRPGSGCTTLLKTIAGETHGISIGKESQLNYQGSRPVRGLEDGFTKLYLGFDQKMIQSTYRGSVSYLAELDVHFPTLTIGETLVIAKRARTPAEVPLPIQKGRTAGLDKQEESVTSLGLSPALDTRVGNDFVPGVSGGERKRLSIAELLLAQTTLQCWDNSTRGLDSSNATKFIMTLRQNTKTRGNTAIVSLYQASEELYKV